MAKFYLLQIKLGKITLAQVPERYRAQVPERYRAQVEKELG